MYVASIFSLNYENHMCRYDEKIFLYRFLYLNAAQLRSSNYLTTNILIVSYLLFLFVSKKAKLTFKGLERNFTILINLSICKKCKLCIINAP